MQPEIEAIAGSAVIFSGMPPEMRARILASAQIRRVDTGETIFIQGEPAASVYIVIDGWVKLYRLAPSGTEAVVSVLTQGRSFGEAVALREIPYPI